MDLINDNSDAIVGIAAATQAIFTIVLVLITRGYAQSTEKIASETRDMATATGRMTQLADNQRLDSTLPIVGFKLADGAQMNQFDLTVVNMGMGPALDLTVALADSPMNWHITGPLMSTAIPAGGTIAFRFQIRQRHPFADSSLVSWPRDDEDKEWYEAMMLFPARGSAQQHEVLAAEQKHNRLWDDYLKEVRIAASEFASGGILRATYRDVHGRELVSWATLDAIRDPNSSSLAWKNLSLGALEFVQPPEVTV